jgi:cytochrome c peroxidase
MHLIAKKLLFSGAIAAIVVFATGASSPVAPRDRYLRPVSAPAPADNQLTPERVQLGKALFFDPRLSGSNWISCATCHNPGLGWSDGLPTGWGHGMKKLGRATPTILNAAFNPIQMWDGRKSTLEDQALGPIGADAEMNQPLPELVAKLSRIEGYRTLFKAAYPSEEISEATIAKAIASFERTVISTESPFDRWRMGDSRAVSDSAKRGFEVFNGKANCQACHSGFNFTDNGFHNIGVKDSGAEDVGRFAQRPVASLKGAFKTPTLRDIALTAPYMRNGAYRTLEEVVEHYDRGGDVKDNLSPEMKPLHLTAQEKNDLVEFMKSLTGKPMQVALPQLPQ